MANNDSNSFADRIRGFREKLERKKKSIKADRRAKGRRIEEEEPETLGEKVEVKKRRTADKFDETKEELSKLKEEGADLVRVTVGAEEQPQIVEALQTGAKNGAAVFEEAHGSEQSVTMTDPVLDFEGDDPDPMSVADPVEAADDVEAVGGGSALDSDDFVGDAEDDLFG